MVSNVFSCVRKQTSNVQKLFCSVLRTVCKHCFNGFSTLFGPPPKNIIQACADDFSSSDVIFGVHDGMFLRSLWNYDSSGWNALKLRRAHALTAACAVWTWPLAAPANWITPLCTLVVVEAVHRWNLSAVTIEWCYSSNIRSLCVIECTVFIIQEGEQFAKRCFHWSRKSNSTSSATTELAFLTSPELPSTPPHCIKHRHRRPQTWSETNNTRSAPWYCRCWGESLT